MPGTKDSPSIARIYLPDNTQFEGLLTSDVSIQLGNKFGALIPGVEMLSDLAQLAGGKNLPAWIGTSTQGWRGTDPIKFSLDMYLINYKPKLDYERKLRDLVSLAAVAPGKTMAGDNSGWSVQAHGGYSPDVFLNNAGRYLDTGAVDIASWAQSEDRNVKQDNMQATANALARASFAGEQNEGTLTVTIGNRFRLSNLLLTSVSVTPSIVEVYSPTSGEGPKPLYYRVNGSFMTCRCAITKDVEGMF